MKKLNFIFKTIIVLVFLTSLSGTLVIYLIKKTALSEKTFVTTAENRKVLELTYNEFIEIMTSDFVALFSETLSKQDIERAFRSAYPEEKFKTELNGLFKTISKYLRDEVDSPNHNLDLVEFKKSISIFFKSRAEQEKKDEIKQKLLKYSNVLANYPDNFPMLRLDDIEHIDEMKENLVKIKSIFMPFFIVTIISLIILLFNIRLLACGILLTGLMNSIGTIIVKGKVASVLARNPEPTRTIATTIASQTTSAILWLSIILVIAGIIILVIKKKN
jgi:hypothetical protein